MTTPDEARAEARQTVTPHRAAQLRALAQRHLERNSRRYPATTPTQQWDDFERAEARNEREQDRRQ